MNIELERGKKLVAGTDGVFIAMQLDTRFTRDKRGVLVFDASTRPFIQKFDGSEPRPIPVAIPLPAPKRRAMWPALLVAGAIGYLVDHGNYGGAAIAGVWLLGWLAQR